MRWPMLIASAALALAPIEALARSSSAFLAKLKPGALRFRGLPLHESLQLANVVPLSSNRTLMRSPGSALYAVVFPGMAAAAGCLHVAGPAVEVFVPRGLSWHSTARADRIPAAEPNTLRICADQRH